MSFDTGEPVLITLVNHATVDLGVDLDALVAALQTYHDTAFAKAWGTHVKVQRGDAIPSGSWGLVFFDTSDQQGALGYHDLTDDGWPIGSVFVKDTLANGQLVSVTACHELLEMDDDASLNTLRLGPDGVTLYAEEVCDAVEETTVDVGGVAMSNFVFPSWFESFRAGNPSSTKYDQLGLVTRPFEILTGGYMPVFVNGAWQNVFGSTAKADRFAREDRRGHRSELRKTKWG